jgi:hypothetical protein
MTGPVGPRGLTVLLIVGIIGRALAIVAWFGYHELVLPGDWTQYVPVVSESSSLAVILVPLPAPRLAELIRPGAARSRT